MDVVVERPPPRLMTAAEFLDWPDDEFGRRQQLVDGELVVMAAASDAHGSIIMQLGFLLTLHLRQTRPRCRAIAAPGVPPHLRAEWNVRIPDLAVVCRPPTAARLVPDPVLVIEILSPSNERETRANVWAYATIPSVQEILLVRSLDIGAELARRGADGSWPERFEMFGPADTVVLDSIGGAFPLVDFYATTSLAP